MASAATHSGPIFRELKKAGRVVGLTDREYELSGRETVRFDRVEVKGDLSGNLDYGGRHVRIDGYESILGLEITPQGAVGPVWLGVNCRVLPN